MSGIEFLKEHVVVFIDNWGEVSISTVVELKNASTELHLLYFTSCRDLDWLSELLLF